MGRAALAQGLPVGKLIIICCALAGACAGLAGFFEVAAIQGRANASLAAGYGYTGILVAFLARHNPLAIVPVAILFGGIVASGGLIERRMGLPDATVLVLQGLTFVVLLTSDRKRAGHTRPCSSRGRSHRPSTLPERPQHPGRPATWRVPSLRAGLAVWHRPGGPVGVCVPQ